MNSLKTMPSESGFWDSNTDMICLGLDIEYAQTITERSMYGLQKVIIHNE